MEHSFFQQDHFQVIWKADAKYILCEKLDMIPDLEPVSIKYSNLLKAIAIADDGNFNLQ